MSDQQFETLTVERRGHVLVVGLNRPEKRNAFNLQMIRELGAAYGLIEHDEDIWVGVIHAHGDHFTGGLDLADVAGKFGDFSEVVPEGGLDPWRNDGTRWTTPVIVAARGKNYTAGIELMLAADIRVGASDSEFLQFEVQRGIFPFGGAMTRFVREAGWGNAMRWILTGDAFGAEEALRIGLIQEIAEPGEELDRALAIADTIANKAAPLAVRGALRTAHLALDEGHDASAGNYIEEIHTLFGTEDAQEGVLSFIERREANFKGK